MGLVPITWQELDAWMRRTSVQLTPWAVRTLRRLSMAYVSESQAAQELSRPAPWVQSTDHAAVMAEYMRERMHRSDQEE